MLTDKMLDKGTELLRKLIEDNSGIVVPIDKNYLLNNRLGDFLKTNRLSSMSDLYHLALNNPTVLSEIIDLMSTNETMWFRDEFIWRFMEATILPEFFQQLNKRKTNRIRIWCAACSTGQEPYSLAMQIDRLSLRYPDVSINDFEILGTDIAESAIKTAINGCFNKIEVSRGLPMEYRIRYFKEEAKGWYISDNIKNRVKFKLFNLQEPFYSMGKFDLILCRNVAIYFSDALKMEVFRKSANILNPDGYFFVGSSESLHAYANIFRKEQKDKVIYYRRTDSNMH